MQRQSGSPKLRDFLRLQWAGHYWQFGPDDFPRVLDWVRTHDVEDERILALSLAFNIYDQAEKPSESLERLQESVKGDSELTDRLEKLLNPVVSEESLKQEHEWADYKRRLERQGEEAAQQRSDWIARLRSDPAIVRSPPGLPPVEISRDQWALLMEVEGDEEQTDGSKGSAWRKLIDEFGEDVARAYRDAAVAHWRRFKPELCSEGGNTRSLPCSLLFAMAGLSIEADEVEEFPRHLIASEVTLALRYVVYERNGFPRWLEPMYEACPKETLDAVLTELFYELDNTKPGEPLDCILHDLVFYAPWLHGALAKPLLSWVRCHRLPSDDALRYSLRILGGGDLPRSELATIAKERAADHSSEHRASWCALWVDAEPETGVEAVKAWLDGLGPEEGSHAAQLFVTSLMGDRRNAGSGASFEYFRTPRHLKALYVLMHRHIRAAEDIDRSGGGVYSPGLRDEAQNARERLFNLLSEIPGKEAYIVLTDLIEEHPHPRLRPWMATRARECAEREGDVEAWSPNQVGEFQAELTRTPETQRQLFEWTVARVTDLKDWLERGEDSPYRTWQKAGDELEIRNLVAGSVRQRWGNPYTVSQEPELANRQRMDISLQSEKVPSSVPIELKLLDKGWTGPDLCSGLRDQLAGDYLREASEGYGLMVMFWKGSRPSRRWRIDGRLVGIPDLCEALKGYWEIISKSFPNVAAVEVVLIDLTTRGQASSVIRDE